ncbi:LADA_0C04060g1_1 [Lachancea dasiensis]|uniref:LADA_0C04060g1_1 n=1 Tax=Lachancea dasiensis TaxID=1072105 RepID=A0A1G4IYN9_9SACH|nr:LADA_0C04060g1_1 [Lachancea dasiensis]
MSFDGTTRLRPTKTLSLNTFDHEDAGYANGMLFRRADSSSSASAAATSAGSGCVTCTGTPACPSCASDEQCVLSLLSCTQCPKTYCAKKNGSLGSSSASAVVVSSGASSSSSGSGSSNNSAKIGGIVGGVVGGIALIVILLLIFLYMKYWRKNRARNKDVLVAHEHYGDDFETGSDSKQDGDISGSGDLRNRDSGALYQARNRSSAATQITKASNILPIAYIPGVTAGSRSHHRLPPLPRHLLRNGDTRSHITLGSSILGGVDDDNDLEGEIPATDTASGGEKRDTEVSQDGGSQDALTTAIRARPKLVQISEEDDEAEENEKHGHQPQHNGSVQDSHRRDEKDVWVTTAAMPSSGESSRQEEAHDNIANEPSDDDDEDDDDDDDDGSFILDVGMDSSIHNA